MRWLSLARYRRSAGRGVGPASGRHKLVTATNARPTIGESKGTSSDREEYVIEFFEQNNQDTVVRPG
jgi:hypothetical protein